MKRLIPPLIIALSLVSRVALALPNPLYFAIGPLGAGTGADPADAVGLASIDTGGFVPSGWTISAVGTIAGYGVNVQVNNLTILIPGGSGFTSPAGTTMPGGASIYINQGVTGTTIDGTGGGYISCTANGFGLANQNEVYGVYAGDGAGGMSIKNLSITNIYITGPADTFNTSDTSGAFYCPGINGSNFFGNIYCYNCSTAIEASGNFSVCVYSNLTFVGCNHGLFPSSATGSSSYIEHCFFGMMSNWDTAGNLYHHDGIIWSGGSQAANFILCGCTFNGDMGANNTAYVYNGGAQATNFYAYNNLFRIWPGNHLNDGIFVGGAALLNNTFIDASGYSGGNTALTLGGYNVIENNIFDGFATYLYTVGTAFQTPIGHNLYVNPSNPGGFPWQIAGTNYNSFASYTNAVGEVQSQLLSSSAAVISDLSSGAPVLSGPASGNGNPNTYAMGVTTDLNGNQRSPTSMDIGAFVCSPVVAGTGSLTVAILPTNAVAAGAVWQVDNGTFQTSGATVSNLSCGQHLVVFTNLTGWITPVGQSVWVNLNTLTPISGTFVFPQASTNGPPVWPDALAAIPISSGSTSTNSGGTTSGGVTNDVTGLVAWWALDDLSGTDSSGNGYTLTFAGGPASVSGEITNAVLFNGTTQSAASSIVNLNYSSGTVTWWQNPSTAYNSSTIRGVWGQVAGAYSPQVALTPEFSCQVYSDNNWYAGWHTTGNDARVVLAANPANYAQGAWCFYALTWSPLGTGLCMNGVQIGTNSTAPSVSNIGTAFCIATQGASVSTCFPGSLDDVRIYDRVLSPIEIANQYQWPTGGR